MRVTENHGIERFRRERERFAVARFVLMAALDESAIEQ